MARMIPSLGPAECKEESWEREIYNTLSQISDEFTVVHSMKILRVVHGNKVEQREGDFVVFHKKLGMLVIESKSGNIKVRDGEWYKDPEYTELYSGPFEQARSFMWKLHDCFADAGLGYLMSSCKMTHAVWFPTAPAHELSKLEGIPSADRALALCKTELVPSLAEKRIRQIMSMSVGTVKKHTLTDEEAEEVLKKIILPSFDIFETNEIDYKYNDYVFDRLVSSQAKVLHFLSEQKMAVINGAAGTGKTIIAVMRAKQAAATGRVLFLCYNAILRDELKKRCKDTPAIDVYSIDGYACKVNKSTTIDYFAMVDRLLSRPELFEYDHVVIDEGQDFGIEEIEKAQVLDTLKCLVEQKENGTMYLFYDKRQFVQGSSFPDFLIDADCKLTLYLNCRNTRLIAESSLKTLTDERGSKVAFMPEIGTPPLMLINADTQVQAAFIDSQIEELKEKGLGVVIITCKAIESSSLRQCFVQGSGAVFWKGASVPVHTVRKFKGMESDAVILIDVDSSCWEKPKKKYEPEPGAVVYTGSSRAKHELRIVGDMNEADCLHALELLNIQGKNKPEKKLAKALGAVFVQ